jgi:F1F0 ATPase subunit 2
MSGIVVALFEGITLGVLFFGGLWWTVRRGLLAPNPSLWFAMSTLARMGAVFTGLYWVAHAGLSNLLVCLVGLLIARVLVIRFA